VTEGSFWPKTWKEAVPLIVWGVLIFASGFEGIATLVHAEWVPCIASFSLMVGLTAMLIHQAKLKSWLIGVNPNWVVATALVALLLVGASPFLDRQRWPLLLIWQTIKPPPLEHPTSIPTSMLILFGGGADAPKVLEAKNTKWQFFSYDYYSYVPTDITLPTNVAEKQCGVDGTPANYFGVMGRPLNCQYKSKKLIILLSFEKPVTFRKLKIDAGGKAFTSWKQEAMTESYAVLAFEYYPTGSLLNIEAAE
jgi:hypothetical protein